jgi:hypothetical protein
LEDYWQRPIRAEELQAEIDRIAQHTKRPEILRELFDALENDPLVIAECLARPALAERFSANLTLAAGVSRPAKNAVAADTAGSTDNHIRGRTNAGNVAYKLPEISTDCADDAWTATSTTEAPDGRIDHTAVWTGSEMIVWGGLMVRRRRIFLIMAADTIPPLTLG